MKGNHFPDVRGVKDTVLLDMFLFEKNVFPPSFCQKEVFLVKPINVLLQLV